MNVLNLQKGLFCLVTDLLSSNFQRRRDRINEKMRALQELIPNCNKVRLFLSFILLPVSQRVSLSEIIRQPIEIHLFSYVIISI